MFDWVLKTLLKEIVITYWKSLFKITLIYFRNIVYNGYNQQQRKSKYSTINTENTYQNSEIKKKKERDRKLPIKILIYLNLETYSDLWYLLVSVDV